MDPRQQARLIESLQNTQTRQRKVIQELQAENARLLSDLVDIRQERDRFRNEAARVRKENAELQNGLEEVSTKYQDLKRERATLLRSVMADTSTHCQCGVRVRRSGSNRVLQTTLPALDEAKTPVESESPVIETTTVIKEKVANPQSIPQYRELPDPPKARSPLLLDVHPSAVVPGDETKYISTTQATPCRPHNSR